jgi:hypothetical protein
MKKVPMILFSLASLVAVTEALSSEKDKPKPPEQAVQASFKRLVFEDRFHDFQINGGRWYDHWWWDNPPYGGKYERLPNGQGLRITNGSIINHPSARRPDGSIIPFGTEYKFGYFEAKMRFSSKDNVADNWGAFWLEGKPHVEQTKAAYDEKGVERFCEIDIFEGWGRNTFHGAQISWTHPPGGDYKMEQNPNHTTRVDVDPLDGEWHIFGLLWEKGRVAWYLDNKLVATFNSFPICDAQAMTIVVSAQSHAKPPNSQTTDVAWVRVWK